MGYLLGARDLASIVLPDNMIQLNRATATAGYT